MIRPGRFDRHIRIDLPDAAGAPRDLRRRARRTPRRRDIDLDELVRRTEGMTPAAIEKVVDSAALAVFREATGHGRAARARQGHLLAALEGCGGQDRPTVEHWTWDSLVLPADPRRSSSSCRRSSRIPRPRERFGVDPPTGLLLAGPPGTGKTTVAKVLAAQARCSFYPVSGADVISKWVGESEGTSAGSSSGRARTGRRSSSSTRSTRSPGAAATSQVHDTQVNQLLAEIDGVAGSAACSSSARRTARTSSIPRCCAAAACRAPSSSAFPTRPVGWRSCASTRRGCRPSVSTGGSGARTDGFSPADLKALCQEAALPPCRAVPSRPSRTEDFTEALGRLRGAAYQPAAY